MLLKITLSDAQTCWCHRRCCICCSVWLTLAGVCVWACACLPVSQTHGEETKEGRGGGGASLLKSQIDATVIRTVTSKSSRSLCCTSSRVTAQQSLPRLTSLKISAVDGEALFLVRIKLESRPSQIYICQQDVVLKEPSWVLRSTSGLQSSGTSACSEQISGFDSFPLLNKLRTSLNAGLNTSWPGVHVCSAAVLRCGVTLARPLSSRRHQCEQQLEGRTAEAVISKSNTIILRGFFLPPPSV